MRFRPARVGERTPRASLATRLALPLLAALIGLAPSLVRAQAPDAPSTPAGPGTSENYVLRPQDGLVFRIVGEPETETEARLAADGTINLPYVGVVRLAGRTVQEARGHLFELYDRDFFVNPQIQLLVVFYAERRIQVLGEVNRPGFVVIPPEEQMTLVQVITAAGGFTRLADQGRVQIRRAREDGSVETLRINVADILRVPNGQDIPIRKGDTIVVPERIL